MKANAAAGSNNLLLRLDAIKDHFSSIHTNDVSLFDPKMSVAPRWKTAIEIAITKCEKSVVIQIASLDPQSPIPHVRSHIFREFLHSPSSPHLPLILTSTDIRTPKTTQFIAHPDIQLVWWIEGTGEQYRISGKASVIPAKDNSMYKYFMFSTRSPISSPTGSPNATPVLSAKKDGDGGKTVASGTGGPAFAALYQDGFDWEEKRRQVFDSMSAHMKASWCRPFAPGSKLSGGHEEAKNWPQKLEGKLEDILGSGGGKGVSEELQKNWEMALGNFALVVIDPTDVDYVELSVVPNRRTRFWRNEGEDGEWEDEAVVP